MPLTTAPPAPAANPAPALQAKTTKKITLRLECKDCKYKLQLALKRCKHFEVRGRSRATARPPSRW